MSAASSNKQIKRSINDLVEEVLVKLWDDESFTKLVGSISNSQTVHGSLATDNVMAALMIRDRAKRDHHNEVAEQNLRTIKRAMRVALRRFGIQTK